VWGAERRRRRRRREVLRWKTERRDKECVFLRVGVVLFPLGVILSFVSPFSLARREGGPVPRRRHDRARAPRKRGRWRGKTAGVYEVGEREERREKRERE
jgi:hypothetical protein